MWLVQGRREMAVLPTVTQYCYITVLRVYGLPAMLLVQGRGEMAVLPAVTAVLLHQNAMDTWTECNIVNTGYRGNIGSDCSYCSYCSTVTL